MATVKGEEKALRPAAVIGEACETNNYCLTVTMATRISPKMSKKYRGKPCTYCVEYPATQPDHVFAREFFLPGRRDNLPKVPACQSCNNSKSKLEHYLTSVLPFGGRHADATTILSEMVPRRLDKNAVLHRQLSAGHSRAWGRFGELFIPSMTVPIDSSKIDSLFRYIVMGLAWHHWRALLAPKASAWAGILSVDGERLFKRMLALNGRRVSGNLGEGTFIYEGLQAPDVPELSCWIFSIYGGLVMAGDPDEPQPKTTIIGGQTATKETLDRFLTLMRAKS